MSNPALNAFGTMNPFGVQDNRP